VEGACALRNSSRRHNQRGIDPPLDRSGSGPVIVVQHAAQALPALDLSRASEVAGFWPDELILNTSTRSELMDLNKDGAMDIVTSTDHGTFIFWGKPGSKSRAAK
jgi:hypothetical protein